MCNGWATLAENGGNFADGADDFANAADGVMPLKDKGQICGKGFEKARKPTLD